MKIALVGYGKMGKTIDRIATEQGHDVIFRIDVNNQEDLQVDRLSQADVAIEFSRPEGAFDNIRHCLEAGVPVVSGTTGWLDQMDAAKAICEQNNCGFVYASNYSIGVNLFFALNEHLASLMDKHPSYEVAMEEIHHTQKLDAPSGTAITLAEGVIGQLDRKEAWVNERSEVEGQVPIISKRIDKVPGTHSVLYQSAIDDIEIKHVAHTRDGFAKGALLAAEWIIGKKGSYGMRDVLGF